MCGDGGEGGEGELVRRGEREALVGGSPFGFLAHPDPHRGDHSRSMCPPHQSTSSRRPGAATFMYMLVPLLVSCAAGRQEPQSLGPALDAQALAAEAAMANRITATSQLHFEWSLREPNLNVRGEGLARVQPPDRARVDLFLGEGSSVLAVALVGDALRMPRGAPRDLIPSAPLLWAVFGIFRPGDASVILGAERIGERVRLRYRLPDSNELHYYLVDGRVVGVEMYVDGDLVHEVDLYVPDVTRLARESVYHNNPSFRELKITVSTVENMDRFPERIWSPGR